MRANVDNVALHEFDLALTAAGLHLVRYGARIAITARDERSARAALELAARELSGLNLRLAASKTRIANFDQEDVVLFGYRYHRSKVAAEPVAQPAQWTSGWTGEFRTVVERIAPAAASFGKKLKARISAGAGQISAIFNRSRTESRRKAFDSV